VVERALYIAVVGAGVGDSLALGTAEEVGFELARTGAFVVCGGLGGVMEAVCRGAKAAGGTTIGILPGDDRSEANRFVDIAIATALGEVRNTLVVNASDALIALTGEFGTLSEIAFALKVGKPVVGLDTWDLSSRLRPHDPVVRASTPREAVERALALARR
jgi:uncharacterized protein (TIGR00725 family)